MIGSLRNLLSSSIDYAGLFPPARLAMEPAIRDYARYRANADAWMLARFVCPAARLAELVAWGDELFGAGEQFAFAVLGRGGETAEQFLGNLQLDLGEAAAFRERFGRRVALDAWEIRLPKLAVESANSAALGALLQQTAAALGAADFSDATVFYEPPLPPAGPPTSWDHCVEALADALAAHAAAHRPAGFKLRTGGLQAAAFPSPAQVARVIAACRDRGLFWKATAGLHHPLRHFDPSVQTEVHGFLNLFSAAILADSASLDEKAIRAILEDQSAESFRFGEHELTWQNHSADAAQIAHSRRTALISFGSCSFDEPRADLAALGWM